MVGGEEGQVSSLFCLHALHHFTAQPFKHSFIHSPTENQLLLAPHDSLFHLFVAADQRTPRRFAREDQIPLSRVEERRV